MTMEDITGSLSAKITALLSDALKLKKYENRSVNDVLMESNNWILLETVREKLKGHMMNDLVAPKLEPLVENAISRIRNLLQKIPFMNEGSNKNLTSSSFEKHYAETTQTTECGSSNNLIDSAMIDKLLKNIRNSSCK